MYSDTISSRVRVLVLGGGIHGVGTLHDLASRGWRDIHLLEKAQLGAGTSSSSTKLVHGGLRYLRQFRDYPLVKDALHERKLLRELCPDLVQELPFYFPILRQGGMSWIMVKSGLVLYDLLAGRDGFANHRLLAPEEINQEIPILNPNLVKKVYGFSDGQTDDLGLVERVAASARYLGAKITEGVRAVRIYPNPDGWTVEVAKPDGSVSKVSALYVVNCLGPWANRFLQDSEINPTHHAINNKGVHVVLEDLGLKGGLFLQSVDDNRIFFLLPWLGYTLLGTTEELFSGDPDTLHVREDEVEYLLKCVNKYLNKNITRRDVKRVFAGLRWLAVDGSDSLTETSRSSVVSEITDQRGLLLSIYGGKLTTYRKLAQQIGDRITDHFGEFERSATDQAKSWIRMNEMPKVTRNVLDRFSHIGSTL